jgi:hypothetical protein
MEKSSQTAWKLVPLRHFFPLKVLPLIEVLPYPVSTRVYLAAFYELGSAPTVDHFLNW